MSATRRWQCPQCGNVYKLPMNVDDPMICQSCEAASRPPEPATRPVPTHPQPQREKSSNPVLKWAGENQLFAGLACVLMVLLLIAALQGDYDSRRPTTLATPPAESAGIENEVVEAPPIDDWRSRLRKRMEDVRITINRTPDGSGQVIVLVYFTVSNNLSAGLIRAGARHDVKRVLEEVGSSGLDVREVVVFGSYDGTPALKVKYDGTGLQRIPSILPDHIYVSAADSWLSPAFRE